MWDLLPGGRQLGGAPANFAYHAAALGANARVISRASASNIPAFPKKLPSVLIATVAALMLSCGFVLTKELLSVPSRAVTAAPRVEPRVAGPEPGPDVAPVEGDRPRERRAAGRPGLRRRHPPPDPTCDIPRLALQYLGTAPMPPPCGDPGSHSLGSHAPESRRWLRPSTWRRRRRGTPTASVPTPIVVPCHRVVASDGKLTGFSAPRGLATKRRMLELEGAPGYGHQVLFG